MKIAQILFCLIATLSSVFAGNLSWVWQNPKPEASEYGNLCVINENVVFVVDADGGTILKTTDGGLTWDINFTPHPDSQPGCYMLQGIDFPDSMTGYAVGWLLSTHFLRYSYAIILKTTDQGATWTFQYTGARRTALCAVDFPQGNNQVGYAAGGKLILKTTNGGQDWIQINSDTTINVRAVHFPVNADTGYTVGNVGTDALLLKTTNGGVDWIRQSSPVPMNVKGVYFADNQTGYAGGYTTTGSYPTGYIIKTTNGGSSWQLIWQKVWTELYSVHFVNSQTGYAGGWAHPNSGWNGTFIMKTTNGGSNWTPVFLPKFMNYELPICFANMQTGYALGYVYAGSGGNGQILKTTDGGISWNFLNTGPEVPFYAVDFPENDLNGYVVGGGGTICKTTDGGANWIQQTTGTGQDFYDVDFLDNQLGFAVGANGTFFKTTNGGNIWIPKNSTTTATLYAVKFVNPQIGYIGGRDSTGGVILKTTDGGNNWISQPIPNNDPIRSVFDLFFFNADTGYASTCNLIYKTTNGGQTWLVNYNPGTSAELHAIDFPVNSQVGYICGVIGVNGQYKVLKTTNGGNSWIGLPLCGGIGPALAVSFADNLIGYVGFKYSAYEHMMKTTNGGTNWFVLNTQTGQTYNDIQAINESIVYAVGSGGMIRKTTNGGQVWIGENKGDGNMNVDSHTQSLLVYPNPFRNNVHIRCRIHDTGYMIKIYDVSGRVVKSFNLESCIMNHESSITWFGDDNLGCELPAGVYFIVPENKSFSPVRVVKIR